MGSVSVGGNAKFYISIHCLKIAFILFDFNPPHFLILRPQFYT